MHTEAHDALVNLKKYIREAKDEPRCRIHCIELIDEFMLKAVVGKPSVEEWADWVVSRYNYCERNAGESLREIALVALRNVSEQ